MATTFVPVETDDQVRELAQLAEQIWNGYWPDLIGQAQTDYMVERFQSLPAIRRGMAEQGYRYWFIVDDALPPEARDERWGDVAGYTGGYAEAETNRFFISKVYLLAGARGRGLCRKTVGFYDELCRAEGLCAMYLTVNKGNELGIRAYLGTGFQTIDAVESDIGGGFVMDDYIMERQASATKGA